MKNLFSTISSTSLRYQLIIGIGSVLTTIIIAITYFMINNQSEFLHAQGVKEAKNRSTMLATNSKVWVLSNDYIGLEEVINNFKIYDDLVFASIINMDGKVIAHTDRSIIGKYIADDKQISYLKKILQPTKVHKPDESEIFTQNNKYIDIVQVIHQKEKHVAWVHIRIDQSIILNNINTTIRHGIIFILVSLFVSIFISYLTAYILTRRLSKLVSTMKKIRQGSKKERAEESGAKEIHQLSKEFNLMLKTIGKGEIKLKELNTFMINIINSVDNILFVKDNDFKYIECNKAFEKLVGKSREQLIGKNDYELFDTEIADLFRAKDKEMLASRKTQSNYEWVTYPDNKEVYLLTSKAALRNTKGEILGIVGNSIDLTKEKKLEEELHNKEEIMISQSRHAAMGEMISMIAHQWRQPISVISMGANNILADISYH